MLGQRDSERARACTIRQLNRWSLTSNLQRDDDQVDLHHEPNGRWEEWEEDTEGEREREHWGERKREREAFIAISYVMMNAYG